MAGCLAYLDVLKRYLGRRRRYRGNVACQENAGRIQVVWYPLVERNFEGGGTRIYRKYEGHFSLDEQQSPIIDKGSFV